LRSCDSPVVTDQDSSCERLLAAGRKLFAQHGYEQASTAAIAREAGTSESQLVRYFALWNGFRDFDNLLRVLIARGKRDGSFASNLNDRALAAAIMGLAEAMIRERIVAERTGASNPFSDAEIRTVFEALMNGVAESRGSTEASRLV
jgi:Bacterial regulatory proteins, tetR family